LQCGIVEGLQFGLERIDRRDLPPEALEGTVVRGTKNGTGKA
jgi:hypothetical protein